MFKGRWKVKELKIRWFCRNCLEKGIAGITIQPSVKPTTEIDFLRIIQTTCHNTRCSKPDIRIHYDSKTQLGN
jgi:hypothetical protein